MGRARVKVHKADPRPPDIGNYHRIRGLKERVYAGGLYK